MWSKSAPAPQIDSQLRLASFHFAHHRVQQIPHVSRYEFRSKRLARARTLHSPINSHLRRVMFMVDNTRRLLRRSVMSLSLLTNKARLRSLCSAPHPSQRPLAEEVTRTRTSCTLQSGIASPSSPRRCLEFTLLRSSSARAALFAPQSSGHQRGEPYRNRRILK